MFNDVMITQCLHAQLISLVMWDDPALIIQQVVSSCQGRHDFLASSEPWTTRGAIKSFRQEAWNT